jgi:hypothetical protein
MSGRIRDLLKSLDELAARFGLDDGDPTLPICLERLPELEEALLGYTYLPECVLAISVCLAGQAGVWYNADLREPERSRDRRHATGHEFGHIHRKHTGYFRSYDISDQGPDRWSDLDLILYERVERECNIISAYMLVRRRALEALPDMQPYHVAGVLDVPEPLVWLRLQILEEYGL